MAEGAPLLSVEGSPPPPGGAAAFLKGSDGTQVRGAHWPARGPARGTIILLQGRTEFIEKYYETIGRFLDLGFGVGAIDWRGQGLSERAFEDRRKGHVTDFAGYQQDADALLAHLDAQGAPTPWIVAGHSMGGAITARLLMRRGGEFHAAVMSAPMLGLYGSGLFNGLASVLSRLRSSKTYATGCDRRTAAEIGFPDNFLTEDEARFDAYARMVTTHDQLALGGPSWGWVRAAYREMQQLRPTETPLFAFIGDKDLVVSHDAVRAYVGAGEDRELLMLPDARHEPFLERDPIQDALWRGLSAFLDRQAPAAASAATSSSSA